MFLRKVLPWWIFYQKLLCVSNPSRTSLGDFTSCRNRGEPSLLLPPSPSSFFKLKRPFASLPGPRMAVQRSAQIHAIIKSCPAQSLHNLPPQPSPLIQPQPPSPFSLLHLPLMLHRRHLPPLLLQILAENNRRVQSKASHHTQHPNDAANTSRREEGGLPHVCRQ